MSCEWIPAPYEEFGDGDYGNHRPGRPADVQSIDYIVVHDTEGTWDTVVDLVRDPTYVSWNYTLRSTDGHIAQHVKAKDVAWHAGNWYVNAKSIGLEHEGFLAEQDAWYTEAMYRSSARLGDVPGQEVRHPAGPAAHPGSRQRARPDRVDHRRHAHRSGPGPGTGATTSSFWGAPSSPVRARAAGW
ncbi:hypothetical protein SALBM311S_12589 [Streptomyces alboniger]